VLILNFAHPLTPAHREQIETLTGEPVDEVIEIKTHFDNGQPFEPQLAALLEEVPLTPERWQTERLLVNPPAYNYVAVLLLAELHGRMGYFPACLRMRPVGDAVPPRFEVAEIMNLQAVRDKARRRR
jgi:hypothetical protein